jgi:hypothetical protein
MKWVAIGAFVVMSACGNGDKPAQTTTVSNTADDTAQTTSESGDALLERLLSEGGDAVYAAADEAGVQSAFEDLSRAIAGAPSITVAMIDAEIETRNGHVASLHSGDTRVYPDQRTMAWMMGVVDALENARAMRAE